MQSWVYNKRISTNSTAKIRSSHRRCSGKKCALRNFAKFTGKDLCRSLFFNKVAGLRPCKKFLRTPVLQNTSGRLLLKNNYQTFKNLFQISSSFLEKQENRLLSHSFFVSVEKNYRSSRSEVFCLNDILNNFAKFAGKYLCQSLF